MEAGLGPLQIMDASKIKPYLKAGDQLISIRNADLGQKKGDVMMVNNVSNIRHSDCVVGTKVHPHNEGRGKMCLFEDGAYRLATPEDKGFVATREFWSNVKDQHIFDLEHKVWSLNVDRWVMAVITALVVLAGATGHL